MKTTWCFSWSAGGIRVVQWKSDYTRSISEEHSLAFDLNDVILKKHFVIVQGLKAMDIEWSDIAVTILWLLVLVGAGAFAYCILFWDRLASGDDPERVKKGWIFRIAIVFNYALVIGVPAIMLVGFVPVMSEAKHLGLTPQDMDLARQYSDTRERLPALNGYLPRLD